jgi:pSer/pThr/pTyr-binding forkhead associated (FHA) protein
MPFCGHCGSRVLPGEGANACLVCGTLYRSAIDTFCSRCGNRVGRRVTVEAFSTGPAPSTGDDSDVGGPRLVLLDEDGRVTCTYRLDHGEAVIGRDAVDISFPDDPYMSPVHARVDVKAGQLRLRDLGSRNGSWVFIDRPTKLADGDTMLAGSQLIRYRRLGYPGPQSADADATRRLVAAVPNADIAVLEQLRSDGSVRDVFHLSPGRSVVLGRETGDWTFPYDPSMSATHVEVRSEDAEFFVHDVGSTNGVAVTVRGECVVSSGQRLLVGDQILRVEQL